VVKTVGKTIEESVMEVTRMLEYYVSTETDSGPGPNPTIFEFAFTTPAL
jgi:hypothetical protein